VERNPGDKKEEAAQEPVRSDLRYGLAEEQSFGPRPRDYREDLPKKVKRLARRSALSYKVKDNQILVVEDFNIDQPKTKDFVKILDSLNVSGKKVLLLTSSNQESVYRSGRNIPRVEIMEASKASTYSILNNQILIMQKSAIDVIVNSFGKTGEGVS
jgi:large subunit ribosomal protein L4